MSVNDAEKNFMALEEERLLRLKEYAHHVSQTYQQFVPKISQVIRTEILLITFSSIPIIIYLSSQLNRIHTVTI
jgi:hypothetical protein